MATFSEDWTKTAAEAAQATQDAVRHYMDESTSLGRSMWGAWSAGIQVGMRTAFQQQNAMLQAARAVVDSTAQANRDWLDQTGESMRMVQDSTSRLVAAGSEMIDSLMREPRR